MTKKKNSMHFKKSTLTGLEIFRNSGHNGDFSYQTYEFYNPEPLTDVQKVLIKKYYAQAKASEKKFFRQMFGLISIDNFDQLVHLFKGGHFVIEDGGKCWQEGAKMEGSKPRRSSHQSLDSQYSFQSKLVKECLFGTRMVNGKKCSWVQLESHATGIRNILGHFLSFIQYKLSGKNIGPYGKSAYTEARPLSLKIPPRAQRLVNAKILENLVFGQDHALPALAEKTAVKLRQIQGADAPAAKKPRRHT